MQNYNFKNNKYSKWYTSIINNAIILNRKKSNDDVLELHHILPKSLGGNDSKLNLVTLTPREHYIVHLLLPKMVNGSDVYKMIAALVRFSNTNKNNSKSYSLLRSIASRYSRGKFNKAYGKRWVHNTKTKEIFFIDSALLCNISGDLVIGLPYQRGGHKNTKAMNNGIKETYVKDSDVQFHITNGWKLGRLHEPTIEHMKHMNSLRHSTVKDAEHSAKLKGRITVKNVETLQIKRIHKSELETFMNNGFVIDKNLTTSLSPSCTINDKKFKTFYDACVEYNISKSTLYYRIKSKSDKWKLWNYS